MSKSIKLSYVLTTFNKIEYLKICLRDLIQNCLVDEEIVVIDGGSTDGTKEYLTELYENGEIHQFLSEKDQGESHGYNKGIMRAQGELIKFITDDDIFCFESIKHCRDFMITNPLVEVINTNGGWAQGETMNISEFTKIYQDFFVEQWLVNQHPFAHCGLGLMIRRLSFSKIGLLKVGCIRADAEFTLRITNSKINLFWYTGLTYVRILNSSSNSIKLSTSINDETFKLNEFYGFDIDKIYFKKLTQKRSFKAMLITIYSILKCPISFNKIETKIKINSSAYDFDKTFAYAKAWLIDKNKRVNEFIGNEKNY